ncbi:Ras-related C3 botulinum toxin substrate 1 isoform X1 [Aphelenchoides fujianensis]|nr:Ras-related C3 botulinum toxin substrate 1 isoform X1 [Aphelenchoides fujianensis]
MGKNEKKTADALSTLSVGHSLSPPSSLIDSLVEELPARTLLIVGDKGVGKTSLWKAFGRHHRRLQRATAQRRRLESVSSSASSSPPSSTAGLAAAVGDTPPVDAKNVDDYFDFQAAEMAEKLVKFRVYDSAGHHLAAHPVFKHREQVDVVLACFSLDSLVSLENVEVKWKPELEALCPKARIVLVGTKADLRDELQRQSELKAAESDGKAATPPLEVEMITTEVALQMVDDIEAAAYAECSAQTHKGIAELSLLAAQLVPAAAVPRKRLESLAERAVDPNGHPVDAPSIRKRHTIARFGVGIKRKWTRAVLAVSTLNKWTRGKINTFTSAISSMFVILTGIILGLFY